MGRAEERESGGKIVAIRRALLFLCLLALLSPALPISPSPHLPPSPIAAHKFHLSFMQLEFNAQEKTAEITLRVFADDLENALSQRSGKPIKLDHKEAPSLIAAYLRDTVELKGRNGQLKKLMWIGMELKADVALLYVEAKMPEGFAGTQLRQQVFFELFEDQVNQVLLKSAQAKASLEFKRGDGFKALSVEKG
ncbi:MAG TPA: DUF6702 family protein [Blastocatellia bacterium]|nr:DUF6702 family protein [Blastocatellia bacterium]